MELLTRIITRNDSTAKWLENSDQVLLKGEMAIEFTESGEPKIKIGDGVTPLEAKPLFRYLKLSLLEKKPIQKQLLE